MPTHRVRNAESTEWIIAAYVPGLEQTMAAQMPAADTDEADAEEIARQAHPRPGPQEQSRKPMAKPMPMASRYPREPPDIVALCDEIMEIAVRAQRVRHPHRPGREHHAHPAPRRRRARAAAQAAQVDPQPAHRPLQGAVANGHRRAADGPGRPVLRSARPAQTQDPHPRRHAAHDARRTDHAAACSLSKPSNSRSTGSACRKRR